MPPYTDTEPKLWEIRSHTESGSFEISQPCYIQPLIENIKPAKKIEIGGITPTYQ